MKENLKWYGLIVLSLVLLILFTGNLWLASKSPGLPTREPSSFENDLPIPLLLDNKSLEVGKAEFDLRIQEGKTEFFQGFPADTLGYNGNYLGPIIKVRKGDDVKINVENTLNEPSTVHWHGLEVIAEMDGGPHQVIDAQSVWSPYFTIDQAAATLWYHPHLLHKTGEQVYKGLAGLFYIEDEFSDNLAIPKDHGINDIPLVVQDKRFASDGSIPYQLNMNDQMNGFMGDSILINGALAPKLDVKNELIRLRVLNGSNARAYSFNFSDNNEFYQIASDGGFLENSVPLKSLKLAPAERAEILLDLSNYQVGDTLFFQDSNHALMKITVVEEGKNTLSIPDKLVEIDDYDLRDVVFSRDFVMSGMGPMVNINGKQMDMNRMDERLKLDELEEWVISNDTLGMGGMMSSTPHPFHVHGVQFRIIERNGLKPALNEQGWKDTVMLEQGEEVKILVKFSKKGLFMYHCHILEHEDAGMMGQFLVE